MSNLKNRTMSIAESILLLLQDEAKGTENATNVIKCYLHIALSDMSKGKALEEIAKTEDLIHERQITEDFTLEQSKDLLSGMRKAVANSRTALKRAEKMGQVWSILEEA